MVMEPSHDGTRHRQGKRLNYASLRTTAHTPIHCGPSATRQPPGRVFLPPASRCEWATASTDTVPCTPPDAATAKGGATDTTAHRLVCLPATLLSAMSPYGHTVDPLSTLHQHNQHGTSHAKTGTAHGYLGWGTPATTKGSPDEWREWPTTSLLSSARLRSASATSLVET